jgi:hypothetical protein
MTAHCGLFNYFIYVSTTSCTSNCLTTSSTSSSSSTLATSTTSLSLRIDGMSSLFPSYGEIDRMMRCLVSYHAYLDLSVNCKFVVSMWLCLHACWSYDPPLGLVKLILYHVNFVIDEAKIEAIKSWPIPATLTQLRSFLRLAEFYCRFVRDFSTIAAPLNDLTKRAFHSVGVLHKTKLFTSSSTS